MGPQWVRMWVEVHEAGRYRGHSCQLSRFCRDYPDICSVIPIPRYSGQKSRTFAALAHAVPSIIHDVDYYVACTNSTLEISIQAGQERRYNGSPTSKEAEGC